MPATSEPNLHIIRSSVVGTAVMTLANMRSLGVRSLDVECTCGKRSIVDVAAVDGAVEVPSLKDRMRCAGAGRCSFARIGWKCGCRARGGGICQKLNDRETRRKSARAGRNHIRYMRIHRPGDKARREKCMAFSYSMRPPKDWQQFERATCVLVRSVLGDPNAQMNGRTGQPQAGVDIWGIRQSSKKLVGIQCKHRLSEPVTAQELKDELAKALTFKPPIDEFILATTAPRDAKIQEAARLLTASMGATDWPVSVFVWGWEDIEEQAEPYPDALKAFDPSHSPYIEKAIDALLTHGGAKLAQLNKRARIIIGTGEPFEAVEPAGANRRRIVRVQLRNETDVEISNGRLAIVNLDPANKGVTECELKRDITIGPRSNCFIDVAVYDIGSSQAVPGKFVTLAVPMVGAFFAEAYEFANLPLQGSSFNLRFSRFSEVFDAVFCALRVDAVGGLLLENKGVSSTVRYAAAPISPGFSPASGIRGGLAVLRISVGESGAYVETKGRSTRYLRRAMQIKVENVDLENAALNVRIAILSIKPQVEYVGPWILKEGFAIAGGADEFIPFVSFGEPYSEGSLPNRYENTDTFMEILVDKNRPLLPRDAVHVVSLRATGIGAAACDFVCKVWVDRTDGRLRIAEVSQTAAVE